MAENSRFPKTYKTELLGICKRDAEATAFKRNIKWLNRRVKLVLNVEEPDGKQVEKAAKIAEALYEKAEYWNRRCNKFLLSKVLLLKNEYWLEDDEEPVAPDEFLRRLDLLRIAISPSGGFLFLFYDEEMFGSHFVEVSGNRKQGFTEFDIS